MENRERLKLIIQNWFIERTSIKPTEDGLNNLVDRIYYNKPLIIGGVVRSVWLVQHKETLVNHGTFSTEEKARKYFNYNDDSFACVEVEVL